MFSPCILRDSPRGFAEDFEQSFHDRLELPVTSELVFLHAVEDFDDAAGGKLNMDEWFVRFRPH